MNGTITIPEEDFHSFLVRMGTNQSIYIPRSIGKYLELSEDSVLLVAIKVVDEDTIREYGSVPKKLRAKRINKPLVNCPVCGVEGRLFEEHRFYNKGTSRERLEYSVRVSHFGYYCHVPIKVARELGWAPPKRPQRKTAPQVECPICGKIGSLSVRRGIQRYTKKNGEESVYKSVGVAIVHGQNDRCGVPLALARERGWINNDK